MGRDLFARVLIGGCYSILIGVFCAVLSSVIGAILGAIAGYFGGKTDAAIIRISEIFQAFPQLVLVIVADCLKFKCVQKLFRTLCRRM